MIRKFFTDKCKYIKLTPAGLAWQMIKKGKLLPALEYVIVWFLGEHLYYGKSQTKEKKN